MKTHTTIRKGFTLIELLTAVAITTVIIGVLIGTTRMSMDAWKAEYQTEAGDAQKEAFKTAFKENVGNV